MKMTKLKRFHKKMEKLMDKVIKVFLVGLIAFGSIITMLGFIMMGNYTFPIYLLILLGIFISLKNKKMHSLLEDKCEKLFLRFAKVKMPEYALLLIITIPFLLAIISIMGLREGIKTYLFALFG